MAVIGGGIGLGTWWFYGHGQFITQEGDLPVLVPEDGPIKVRPDSPGGMEVPHRDTTIYQELDESGGDVAVVIDAIPDMPKAPDASELGPPPDARNLVGDQIAIDTGNDITAPKLDAPSSDGLQDSANTGPASKPAEKSAAAPNPPPTAVESSTDGEFRIQLASLRDETQASVAWKKIASENKDLVGNLKMFVQRVDLGDKGVFYRLQAGPLDGLAAADKICSELKQRNVGCLSVRP
ncbi:SPOR domain-containing protein [Thalassospira mesophila]|nr:SPOR domain-containing protein [Thalassospira mesophila]